METRERGQNILDMSISLIYKEEKLHLDAHKKKRTKYSKLMTHKFLNRKRLSFCAKCPNVGTSMGCSYEKEHMTQLLTGSIF